MSEKIWEDCKKAIAWFYRLSLSICSLCNSFDWIEVLMYFIGTWWELYGACELCVCDCLCMVFKYECLTILTAACLQVDTCPSVCMCHAEVQWMPVPQRASWVWRRLIWNLLSHACVCFLSLSHSDVCPPTGQCPNGLSCFPSLSFCKYSGSRSDFTRTRPRSVHACPNANMHITFNVTHLEHICPLISSLTSFLLQSTRWP